MIAMKFTIELDVGLSFLLQAALPQLMSRVRDSCTNSGAQMHAGFVVVVAGRSITALLLRLSSAHLNLRTYAPNL
jgi:hypothetical protein